MTRTWSPSGPSETELTLSTLGSIHYPLQFHCLTSEVLQSAHASKFAWHPKNMGGSPTFLVSTVDEDTRDLSRPVLIAHNTNLLTKLHLVFSSPSLSAIVLGLISHWTLLLVLTVVDWLENGLLSKGVTFYPVQFVLSWIVKPAPMFVRPFPIERVVYAVAVTVCSILISAIQHNHVFSLPISFIWHTSSFSRYLNSCLALTF